MCSKLVSAVGIKSFCGIRYELEIAIEGANDRSNVHFLHRDHRTLNPDEIRKVNDRFVEFLPMQLHTKSMCFITNSLLSLIFVRVLEEAIYFISTDAVLFSSSLFLLLYLIEQFLFLQVLVHRLHKEPVI